MARHRPLIRLGLIVLAVVTLSMTAQARAADRVYYIAADEVIWNYAPSAVNKITGRGFSGEANEFTRHTKQHIGRQYVKALYRQYTDATFTKRIPRAHSERYLGVLGPIIRAEVGDTVTLVFKNHTHHRLSVHVHGLRYDKGNEGAPYSDGNTIKDDDMVPPRAVYTYHFDVPERSGPGPMDSSSIMWMYHSHTDEVADTNAGLMGPIVVTRQGMARPDGTPIDVDREVFADFQILNENQSLYLRRNTRRFLGHRLTEDEKENEDFQESNLKHSINGYLYGNQPMIDIPFGKVTRWYLMAMGNEADLHTPHWHGNTVSWMGMNVDVLMLAPAFMTQADMVADEPGTWLFHCHVSDHIIAGMQTRYQVQ
jgi:FtsP/CotA-like multicopper oxidase with cupredoxin domain